MLKIVVFCPENVTDKLNNCVKAIKENHTYKTPVIDVYKLENII